VDGALVEAVGARCYGC